jgi:predicted DNA-binding protein (MmcQ/YjbR family)
LLRKQSVAEINPMNVDTIREFCLTFPQVTEKLQWGDALCFKISGKMFVVMGLDHVRLTFKCTPEVFADLIERDDIRPSPYLGRYSWVMLDRLDAVGWSELQELIQQSYEMVAEKAPRKKPIKKKGLAKAAHRKKRKNA